MNQKYNVQRFYNHQVDRCRKTYHTQCIMINTQMPHGSKKKRHITSHISLHTWSWSHWGVTNSWRKGNHTGRQDENKNTDQANILCCLTFAVFRKHSFFVWKTFVTTIAVTPCCRTVLYRSGRRWLEFGGIDCDLVGSARLFSVPLL